MPYYVEAFFIFQGLIVNATYIYSYRTVYLTLKSYHRELLDRNSAEIKEELAPQTAAKEREVKIFFILLCQMLFVQIIWIALTVLEEHNHDENVTIRIDRTILLLLMASYALMYFGFS